MTADPSTGENGLVADSPAIREVIRAARAASIPDVLRMLGRDDSCPKCSGSNTTITRENRLLCRSCDVQLNGVELVSLIDGSAALEAAGRIVNEIGGPPESTLTSVDTADPLRDLPHLSKVALVGADRMRDLAAQPVVYLWQDIAIPAIIVLLAGGPGEGKTTLLFLILAARLSRSGPVTLLGRYVQPAPVGKWIVLIEGEHAEASACRKLIRSMRILVIDDSALDRLILIARKAVRLQSPEWNDIVKLIAMGLVSDVAIDTVARVAPADGNDEREQVAVFDSVAQAIDAAPRPEDRPVVWAVAHTRKNGATGDLADVSGSAQRTGQADTVLLVKGERVGGRTVSSTVTFAKLREEPDEYPTPTSFAIVRDETGYPTIRTSDVGDDADPLDTRILNQLALGPKTKNKLAAALSRSRTDVDVAISMLFATRRIQTTEIKVNGRTFKGFMVRPTDASTGRPPDEHPQPTTTDRDGLEND